MLLEDPLALKRGYKPNFPFSFSLRGVTSCLSADVQYAHMQGNMQGKLAAGALSVEKPNPSLSLS